MSLKETIFKGLYVLALALMFSSCIKTTDEKINNNITLTKEFKGLHYPVKSIEDVTTLFTRNHYQYFYIKPVASDGTHYSKAITSHSAFLITVDKVFNLFILLGLLFLSLMSIPLFNNYQKLNKDKYFDEKLVKNYYLSYQGVVYGITLFILSCFTGFGLIFLAEQYSNLFMILLLIVMIATVLIMIEFFNAAFNNWNLEQFTKFTTKNVYKHLNRLKGENRESYLKNLYNQETNNE